jgi:hypothetical protein
MTRHDNSSVSHHRFAACVLAGATLLGTGTATASIGLAALTSAPAGATAMAPVTVTGKVVKIISTVAGSSSFEITVGMKHYVVKCNAMTRIKLDDMTVKMSKLKLGDTVTVKGPLEMGAILATSIVIAGM